MAKTGLVVEGGGMKCAYSAGILDRLLDEKIHFDYISGVSAGSANAASFLAGQRGRNLRFYTEHINDPDYFGVRPLLTTGNLFGLDHIYGTLTNEDGGDPLDYDAIVSDPAEFVIVATDAETGRPHYFNKSDLIRNDYKAIKASCALPVVCRPITIDGRQYFDGGVSDAIPVRRAIDDGCERLVVILSKPRDFVKTPEKHRAAYRLACAKYPAVVRALDRRHIMYGHVKRQVLNLERHGRAFVFAPSEKLPMGTYEMNAEHNQALYDLGISDFDKMIESLRDFLH